VRRLACAAMIAALVALQHGCAAQASSIENVRALSPYPDSSARVSGIANTSKVGDRVVANVLFVHGIGWTQRDRADQWVLREADAIQQAVTGIVPAGEYTAVNRVTRLCKSTDPHGGRSTYAIGGLQIHGGERWFSTDDPNARVHSTWVGCLDRIEIDLKDSGVINLYRFLWDDLIYDAYQYPLVGYDDGIRTGHEPGGSLTGGRAVRGYEDLHGLRAPKTAQIKAEMVSYGLSEASLYLGPVGELMREGVAAAICAVINEASGATEIFNQADRTVNDDRPTNVREPQALCQEKPGGGKATLTIVSESLGSKVVFDTLRGLGMKEDLHAALRAKVGTLQNEVLEVFLLSNQLPVLGAGTASMQMERRPQIKHPALRFIAVSEINDALSYELVPYFEHLYVLRCMNRSKEGSATVVQGCDDSTQGRLARLDAIRGTEARRQLVEELGFQVVDVRVRYAKPVHWTLPDAVDPLAAHTGYLSNADVTRLLVCGLSSDVQQATGCRGFGRTAKSR